MSQLQMFGQNIFFLIGILLSLAFGSVVLVAVWIGLRIGLFRVLQRRAQDKYRRQTRRADGQMYPPVAGGICQVCGRVSAVIYYPASGEKLCAPCYEDFWRRTEPMIIQHTKPSRATSCSRNGDWNHVAMSGVGMVGRRCRSDARCPDRTAECVDHSRR